LHACRPPRLSLTPYAQVKPPSPRMPIRTYCELRCWSMEILGGDGTFVNHYTIKAQLGMDSSQNFSSGSPLVYLDFRATWPTSSPLSASAATRELQSTPRSERRYTTNQLPSPPDTVTPSGNLELCVQLSSLRRRRSPRLLLKTNERPCLEGWWSVRTPHGEAILVFMVGVSKVTSHLRIPPTLGGQCLTRGPWSSRIVGKLRVYVMGLRRVGPEDRRSGD